MSLSTNSILFATKNPGKLKEFKETFNKFNNSYTVLSLDDLGYEISDCEETGSTFFENAVIKAKNVQSQLKPMHKSLIVIADDSGMVIDALNGEPGVHTRRCNGSVMTDEEIIEYCLTKLRGTLDRKASYVTNFVILYPDGVIKSVLGRNDGVILEKAREGSILKGMPFRALFYIPSLGAMFHEVREMKEKDRRGYSLGYEEAIKEIVDSLA